jgi:hypothetical protein
MKVLMLWRYYPEYLSYFYKKNPYAYELSFEEHLNEILNDHFGWPGDLSRYMNKMGIETLFIIENAESLQKKWAIENGFEYSSKNGWKKEIVMEQIKHFQPDILWITSIFDYYGDFVRNALPYCKKAITWVSCPTPPNLDISGFTDLITSHPNMLKDQQHLFDKVVVTKPGFDPAILGKIGDVEKKYDITFIGGITPYHHKRMEILAYLIENGIDLKVFGYFFEPPHLGPYELFKRIAKYFVSMQGIMSLLEMLKYYYQKSHKDNLATIRSTYLGQVFGLDMYRTLAESYITLNIHGDIAGNYAGNIRMFESTGIGTCLLTENFENINELFEPGKDILTYNSKEELLEIIYFMLNQNEEIELIAKAGQKRTLKEHTIERMFNDIKHVFEL